MIQKWRLAKSRKKIQIEGKTGRKIYFKPLLENFSLHVSTLFIFHFTRWNPKIKCKVEGYCHLIYNQNLSRARSKAVDIVLWRQIYITQQALLKPEGNFTKQNCACNIFPELTVDCIACEPEQATKFSVNVKLLPYSNREAQLCGEGAAKKLNKIFLYVCFSFLTCGKCVMQGLRFPIFSGSLPIESQRTPRTNYSVKFCWCRWRLAWERFCNVIHGLSQFPFHPFSVLFFFCDADIDARQM